MEQPTQSYWEEKNRTDARRIRISASFNRASNIVAALIRADVNSILKQNQSFDEIIDLYARGIYAKETAFEQELIKQDWQDKQKKVGTRSRSIEQRQRSISEVEDDIQLDN